MLNPQKKISRKEIQHDKLVTYYYKLLDWFENNKNTATYIMLIPIVIGALWFFWDQKTNEWEQSANLMLSKVIPLYENAEFDSAINGVAQTGTQGLLTIVNEYGSTNAGQYAKLYLANAYYAKKNYDEAIKYYDDISIKNSMITSAALAGLASCYEAKKEYEQAAKYFEEAASKFMTGSTAPEYLYKAALNYAKSGEKDDAKEMLELIKKEFATSTYAKEIDRVIAEFGI